MSESDTVFLKMVKKFFISPFLPWLHVMDSSFTDVCSSYVAKVRFIFRFRDAYVTRWHSPTSDPYPWLRKRKRHGLFSFMTTVSVHFVSLLSGESRRSDKQVIYRFMSIHSDSNLPCV